MDNLKRVIIDFKETDNGTYNLEISSEMIPKIMKYLSRGTISEDVILDFKIS